MENPDLVFAAMAAVENCLVDDGEAILEEFACSPARALLREAWPDSAMRFTAEDQAAIEARILFDGSDSLEEPYCIAVPHLARPFVASADFDGGDMSRTHCVDTPDDELALMAARDGHQRSAVSWLAESERANRLRRRARAFAARA